MRIRFAYPCLVALLAGVAGAQNARAQMISLLSIQPF
jgi:hypothetical protein